MRLIFMFYFPCMKHCTLFRCCQNQVPRSKHHVTYSMYFLLRHIFLHIYFHICSTRSSRFVLEIYFTTREGMRWVVWVLRGLFCQRDVELLTGVWNIRAQCMFGKPLLKMTWSSLKCFKLNGKSAQRVFGNVACWRDFVVLLWLLRH